nr:T9SS type A sorting domain-containing protein [Bacteroidota bacterium]
MKKIIFFIVVIVWAITPMFTNAQNNALDFNSANQEYINIGTGPTVVNTIEFWVNPTTTSINFLGLAKLNVITNILVDELGTITTYNFIDPIIYINGVVSSTLPANAWSHVAITTTTSINANGFMIGSSGHYLDGKMDEFRLWSDVRTQAEIRANMYQEVAGGEAGLVAYYKLNETTGTTANDSQTSGTYDGTLTGGFTFDANASPSPAFFGPKNCLNFDGSDENILVDPFSPTLSGAGTISFWIKLNEIPTDNARLISKGNTSAGGDEIYLLNNDGRIATTGFIVGDDLTSSNPLSTGVWTHVAITADGSGSKLYINGVLDDTGGAAAFSYDSFRIGGQFTSLWETVDASMDELRVWNDVRTVTEIREYMCKNLTGNETGLVAYYNFDNKSGTILQDFSGNDNDGTLYYMDPATDWIASTAFNTWLNTNADSWTTASNWSRGSAPVSTDNVGVYTYSGGTDAILDGSPEVNNFLLGGSSFMEIISEITVNGSFFLESDLDLYGQTITLGSTATLVEGTGILYGTSGTITTTRDLNNITAQNVAGLGATITTSANMGSTVITRGLAFQTGGYGNESIKRYYDIAPTTNTGLNATLVFNYYDSELNGLTEADLVLFRSTDGGSVWIDNGGTVETGANTITLASIDAFSRWTAGSTSATLEGPIYVNVNASGSNDGTTWANAFTSFQSALDVAVSGKQIWVAKGTYYPSVEVGGTGDRYQAFQMINGVSIYGGFAGTETSTAARTDYGIGGANETILSGDIGVVDDADDNCCNVFSHPSGTALTSSAVLNGFTISDGNANLSVTPFVVYRGGGMHNSGSSPTITNCNFTDNYGHDGGGMYNSASSSPNISNCTFTNNDSYNGGGMYNSSSSPTITNCSFTTNTSSSGSGMCLKYSSPTLTNCNFTTNTTSGSGAGILMTYNSAPTFINCLFANNNANGNGGGLVIQGYDGYRAQPTFINSTFANNYSGSNGGAIIASNYFDLTIKNCILWGNTSYYANTNELSLSGTDYTGAIYYSDIKGCNGSGGSWNTSFGTDGGNNIDTNPHYADAGNNDYRLSSYSPCADVGSDAANSETYDIRGTGYGRKLNKSTGASGTIDMGAYEFKFGTDPEYALTTWTGTSTTAWNTEGNWSGNDVPTMYYNITIPDVANDPVIAPNASANCNNLTIGSGSAFTIQSDATGVGSLITSGTITNNGTVSIQRYVSESIWHLISVPNNVTTANTFLGDYLQTWDEATHSWTDISDPETVLNPKQGYSLWATPGKATTYTFTGTPLTGNQSQSVTFTEYSTEPDAYEGANLLGNPYPSSIDWSGLDDTWGAVYYWDQSQDGGAGDYVEWNDGAGGGSQYIPPMQGFFIVTGTGGTFSLTNADRTHEGTSNYYKSESELENGLVLLGSNGSFSDELYVIFSEETNTGFELHRDAWKLVSTSEGVSQLYSFCEDGKLAIDVRPETEVIQLGFQNNLNGINSIGIKEIAGISEAILEDTKTETFHNLINGNYEFVWDITDDEKRFKLHLDAVGIEENIADESSVLIFASNRQIFIKGAESGEVIVSDMMGRVVMEENINGRELNTIPLKLKTGIYVVMVRSGNEVQTEKIYIK